MRSTTMMMTMLSAWMLGGCAGDDGAGSDTDGAFADELEFRGEQPFLPGLDIDTGWIPADAPAAVRATAAASGGVVVTARATTDGQSMTPVPDSGELSVDGGLSLELSARIDAVGVSFEGVVDSFEIAIEPASTTFDPFSIDSAVTVQSMLPAQVLGTVPIPSVPGASLIVEVTGGELTTQFVGTCADTADGHGQFVGQTAMSGTVACAATIEIEIPIVGTETFGPFAFDIPIPSLGGPMDLGTRSLSTGQEAAAMEICSGGATTAADQADDTAGGDPTGQGGDAGTDDGTTGASDANDADSDGTDTQSTAGATDTSTDSTGGLGDDPDYPNPGDAGCPGDEVPVQVPGDPNAVCLPPCDGMGLCPSGQTGGAVGVCLFNPDSSQLDCMTEDDCFSDEVCSSNVCVLEPPTHCVLACDDTAVCPDAMTCQLGACVYAQ